MRWVWFDERSRAEHEVVHRAATRGGPSYWLWVLCRPWLKIGHIAGRSLAHLSLCVLAVILVKGAALTGWTLAGVGMVVVACAVVALWAVAAVNACRHFRGRVVVGEAWLSTIGGLAGFATGTVLVVVW